MKNYKPPVFHGSYYLFLLFAFLLFSCNSNDVSVNNNGADSLTDEQKRLPENALKGLVVTNGLEVRTMATEPMLKNPTITGLILMAILPIILVTGL
jgi:hypothetical protein